MCLGWNVGFVDQEGVEQEDEAGKRGRNQLTKGFVHDIKKDRSLLSRIITGH